MITLQKTPKDLFNIEVLAENLNIDKEEKDRIKWLISRKGNLAFAISQLVSQGINIVTRADKIYPKIYKTKLKKNTPPVIYYAGNLALLEQDNIAVVGSRNVDEIGIDFTTEFVKKMCKENYNIVSGGARGVDSVAEQIALKNNGNIIIIVSDNMEKKLRIKKYVMLFYTKSVSFFLSFTLKNILKITMLWNVINTYTLLQNIH